MLQHASSLRYSLEGYLKRTLFERSIPLLKDELIECVLENWLGTDSKAKSNITGRIESCLTNTHGPFIDSPAGWQLRLEPLDDLHQAAFDFLHSERCPKTHKEILRHIVEVTKRSRGELMSRLDLDRFGAFARLESGEWVLSEWRLINEQIEWLEPTEEGINSTKIIDATKNQESPDMNKEPIRLMETQKDLVALILLELQAFERQLLERDQEIPGEVMQLFELENLPGIEHLMAERKNNSEFVQDLSQLLQKWSSKESVVVE